MGSMFVPLALKCEERVDRGERRLVRGVNRQRGTVRQLLQSIVNARVTLGHDLRTRCVPQLLQFRYAEISAAEGRLQPRHMFA